jgi:hypothetical protein
MSGLSERDEDLVVHVLEVRIMSEWCEFSDLVETVLKSGFSGSCVRGD